jgi:hypothetical protein
MYGRDGVDCRYCHELFCDDCGDIVGRVCDTCGDEQADLEAFVRQESMTRAREDVEEGEQEYGDVGDLDYFGDGEKAS